MNKTFLLPLVLSAAACGSPVEPLPDWGDFQLPAPDESLDPSRLSVGEFIATPCSLGPYGDNLDSLRNRHEWVVVDIYFGRNTPQGPWDGPNERDKAWVTARDGRVLYDFSVPAVRARIVASAIPDLVSDMLASAESPVIRDVPDLSRYDIPALSVSFATKLSDEHVASYESLGGRIEYRFDFINSLSGVLPDRSVQSLRDRWKPAHVQASGVSCLA